MATSMMTSRMSMMTSRYRYNRKNPFPNIKENNSLVNQPNKVQIFDKNGNDVTPLPMINPNKNAGKPQKTGSTSSQSDVSLSSLTKEQSYTEYISFFESQLTKSYSMASQMRQSDSISQGSKMPTSLEKHESALSSDSENEIEKGESTFYLLSKDADKKIEVNPNKRIYITLTETPTICLFDMQNKTVFSDIPNATELQDENTRYQQLLQNKKNNDNFIDKISQTINNDPKEKEMQTELVIKTNQQTQANVWDIYDSMKMSEQQSNQNDDFLDYYESSGDKDTNQESMENISGALNMVSESSLTQQSTMMLNSSTLGKSMFQTEMNSESVNNSNSVIGSTFDGSMSTNIQNKLNNDSSDKTIATAVSLSSLNQENIINSLHIMECAVVSNNYYDLLVEYRDLPSLKGPKKPQKKTPKKSSSSLNSDEEDEEEENEEFDENDENNDEPDTNLTNFLLDAKLPSLPFLWSFKCDLSRGRNVTEIAWNKKCEDIIAVSYEELKSTSNNNAPKGLILCWSLKNSEYPSRVFKLDTPVTTIDFSQSNPNLLAAGFMDGRVVIFDIRSKSNIPVLENHESGGKHNDPVWDMKWVERERILGDEQSKGEILMTISTDGRVIQWNLNHGLEFTELMFMKRVTEQDLPDSSNNNNNNKTENNVKLYKKKKIPSFISRLAGGLCFDFNSKDSNIYLAGTEDGVIHKCSCSYSEQYLQSYFGHSGPIYKIRWSPFLPNIFLTCSSDWTIRLWSQDEDRFIFKFENEKDTITDIQWSPMCSTVFGAVTNSGRIEIWDLSFSILDPIIVHQVMNRKLTCIKFSKSYPIVLISDDEGNVNIYKLKNFDHLSKKPFNEQVDLLQNIIIHRNEISSIQNNNNPVANEINNSVDSNNNIEENNPSPDINNFINDSGIDKNDNEKANKNDEPDPTTTTTTNEVTEASTEVNNEPDAESTLIVTENS
ncbi:WD40 repeat-like protein [Neocallimastix lanati (nom. inval.)]|jgi:WD40 repeat protein|uniref:Dynein axonemal intermediate chain 4 n=1 Tax=Neocallimastix californiae TaxID=1754190 RepID=A0A1Y2AXA1_9FUNG|nr:WD40 repeat-like protein [Neocallimastix sp. JGI-2020a]ORY26525.1 WD40 repeat-like protein [Neocallimastix californiae]|eukprot:ORY26525.1 WD40 repeat-like protein [Neocallimastix californiae]